MVQVVRSGGGGVRQQTKKKNSKALEMQWARYMTNCLGLTYRSGDGFMQRLLGEVSNL